MVRRLEGLKRGAQCVKFFSDGRRGLGSGDGKDVCVWDLETGRTEFCLEPHSHAVDDVGISPDEQTILAACRDKTAWQWDLASGQLRRQLQFPHRAYRVVVKPGGFWVVCTDEQAGLSLWDAETDRELCQVTNHTGPVWGIQCSFDRRFLLTGGTDKTVRLWKLPNME